ncbi:MAG: ATP-binding cassette domain-containing protein [Propionibacteriaceae bacterium]|jgi:ATPase subunit of ABC transporter with duplicated ATPase domains|nr:ATP-binding cassette domain-containing protein [Propionibacteriaceae bacterium]
MGHIEVAHIDYYLPDGRMLLADATFRIGQGAPTALVGPNGAGKSTLLRLITGELTADEGTVATSGGVAVMPQFIGSIRDERTVRDLLLLTAPAAMRAVGQDLARAEAAMLDAGRAGSDGQDGATVRDGKAEGRNATERRGAAEREGATDPAGPDGATPADDEAIQLAFAQAISDWGDIGGYNLEARWDEHTMSALGLTFDEAQHRLVRTLSGGEQKRLVLEALLAGDDEVLLLDEPDNYLDVPGKLWLEERLATTAKTVLFASHDRELLANVAKRIVSVEPAPAGSTVWVHGGGFATYHQARVARFERFEELQRRWAEQRAKLKQLVADLQQYAQRSADMASRYQAAKTRLAKFEQAGPPPEPPRPQEITVRLRGGRTGVRALTCEGLELVGLMEPFDAEVFFGERVAVLGGNGTGKSHFITLLAGMPVETAGTWKLGARVVPGYFAQTHAHPELIGRQLVQILWQDHALDRGGALSALRRYELTGQADQLFDTLSGGQQARFQILLLELGGATMFLLDEPTDNLDLESADALQSALEQFEGTVIAVTHDRWFAKGFDRFLIFDADGRVRESLAPVWTR